MFAHYLGPAADNLDKLIISLVEPPVPAGAPGPPESYREVRIDIGNLLLKHPAASFLWRARGDSMIGAGIHSGDYLLVDRAVPAVPGRVVVATVNGENTVKRISADKTKPELLPENPNYKSITIDDEAGIQVFGVVTWVLHPL
jgi:DNA polymerase V